MAKKSQTNARRNNTKAGRRVVNFYNHGTVNVDARQNNSRTTKKECSGCTFNYPYFTPEDYFTSSDQPQPTPSTEVVCYHTPKKQNSRNSCKRNIRIATGIAIAAVAVGLSIAAIKYFN